MSTAEFCGTGVKMQMWKFRVTDECPLCNTSEDNGCVIRCRSDAGNGRWSASIGDLEAHLLDNNTPSHTVNMSVNQLHLWRGDKHEVPTSTSETLSSAVLAQNLIGWYAFLEGFLTVEWKIHASTFKQSLQRWTALLVKKLWMVAFDMWDHRCKLLHENDLSNKVQNLQATDQNTRNLLRVHTIELHPHERRIFYIADATIFSKTPKFRRK